MGIMVGIIALVVGGVFIAGLRVLDSIDRAERKRRDDGIRKAIAIVEEMEQKVAFDAVVSAPDPCLTSEEASHAAQAMKRAAAASQLDASIATIVKGQIPLK